MSSRPTPFRPRFTLLLLYVLGFFLLYAMLFALPDLIAGVRELEPATGALTPEELERAKQISQRALGGGKVLISLVASLATVGIGLWRNVLPGLGR